MSVADAIEITAGGSHACARRASGLYCWGFSAQVGDGTVERRLVPTAVSTTTTVTAIRAGNNYTLAQTELGTLICWGRAGVGQCGDGAETTHLAPVPTLSKNVMAFDAGGDHACAHSSNGITTCWGSNDFGEIGSGTRSTSTPLAVVW